MPTPQGPKKKTANGVRVEGGRKTAAASTRRQPATGKFVFLGVGVLLVAVAAAGAFFYLGQRGREVARPSAAKTGPASVAAQGAAPKSEPAAAKPEPPAKQPEVAKEPETATPEGPEPPVPTPPVDASRLLVNSLGMKLVLIPAGEFDMGAGDEDAKLMKEAAAHEKDPDRFAKDFEQFEHPRHHVRISKPFYLGAFEVTQAEYEQLGGKKAEANAGQHPVARVSWIDAFTFCQKLSAVPQEAVAKRFYRLPTEAEWEYACRAGASGLFCCGNDAAQLADYATMEKRVRTVGQKKPNAWGLYDMHGNAREWCWDWFLPSYYESSPAENPLGPQAGRVRAVRGGSEGRLFSYRSAARRYFSPALAANDIGFRVVCQVPEAEKVVAPAVDKIKKIEFDAAIQAARVAMGARELVEAKKYLATAKSKAQSPDEASRVTRYETVLGYVEDFWRCIRGTIASLHPTEELDLGKERIVVLKSSADGVTFKIGDRECQYTCDTMPTGFIVALADVRLNKDPQTKVIYGAFLAVDPMGDAERAAQLWAEAAQSGEKVQQLVPPVAELAGEHAIKRSTATAPAEEARPVMPLAAKRVAVSPETIARLLAERLRAIQGSSRTAPAAEWRNVFDQAAALGKEAMAADLYDIAMDAAKVGSAQAAKLREKPLVKLAHEAMVAAQKGQKAFAPVSSAKKTLLDKPDDPEANLVYGSYLCFVKNDWPTGLPMLKKSSNKALASLAAKDETGSEKPDEQLAIADLWLGQLEQVSNAERRAIQVHAGMWAYRASFQLTGSQKTAAEKRARQAGLQPQITNPVDGSVLVLIPEGKCLVGEYKEEVYLPAYYLGLCEVSVAQYGRFVQSTGHALPGAGRGIAKEAVDRPVTFVTCKDAMDYCAWAGLRLPTGLEWEKGARGTDGRRYPWGKDWDPARCRNGLAPAGPGVKTFSVLSYPEGRSVWGLYNMSGNVWEWCSDTIGEGEGLRLVRRGGGFEVQDERAFTCYNNVRATPTEHGWSVGFRVARDLRP
jgi:formylglycine-generating enzyme required for sulfatase activity